jgi:hypothetical protein
MLCHFRATNPTLLRNYTSLSFSASSLRLHLRFYTKSFTIETTTTSKRGRKIVGLPPESEMAGIICRMPMNKK